jgi:hypothetical protein
MGYLDKSSSDPSLPMNQPLAKPVPVAWRSREKGSIKWRVHESDPTDNLKKYAVGEYEVEPLYAH